MTSLLLFMCILLAPATSAEAIDLSRLPSLKGWQVATPGQIGGGGSLLLTHGFQRDGVMLRIHVKEFPSAEAAREANRNNSVTNAVQLPLQNKLVESLGLHLVEFRSMSRRAPDPIYLYVRGARENRFYSFRMTRSYQSGETEPSKNQMILWLEPIVKELVAAVEKTR
jgi:hypothetical protein